MTTNGPLARIPNIGIVNVTWHVHTACSRRPTQFNARSDCRPSVADPKRGQPAHSLSTVPARQYVLGGLPGGARHLSQPGQGGPRDACCQEDDRRKSTAAGFDGHLVKPVDPETLEELSCICIRLSDTLRLTEIFSPCNYAVARTRSCAVR